MKRKIVQLITKGDVMFALCDDGSVWKLCHTRGRCIGQDLQYEWVAIPGVPQ